MGLEVVEELGTVPVLITRPTGILRVQGFLNMLARLPKLLC